LNLDSIDAFKSLNREIRARIDSEKDVYSVFKESYILINSVDIMSIKAVVTELNTAESFENIELNDDSILDAIVFIPSMTVEMKDEKVDATCFPKESNRDVSELNLSRIIDLISLAFSDKKEYILYKTDVNFADIVSVIELIVDLIFSTIESIISLMMFGISNNDIGHLYLNPMILSMTYFSIVSIANKAVSTSLIFLSIIALAFSAFFSRDRYLSSLSLRRS